MQVSERHLTVAPAVDPVRASLRQTGDHASAFDYPLYGVG